MKILTVPYTVQYNETQSYQTLSEFPQTPDL